MADRLNTATSETTAAYGAPGDLLVRNRVRNGESPLTGRRALFGLTPLRKLGCRGEYTIGFLVPVEAVAVLDEIIRYYVEGAVIRLDGKRERRSRGLEGGDLALHRVTAI